MPKKQLKSPTKKHIETEAEVQLKRDADAYRLLQAEQLLQSIVEVKPAVYAWKADLPYADASDPRMDETASLESDVKKRKRQPE